MAEHPTELFQCPVSGRSLVALSDDQIDQLENGGRVMLDGSACGSALGEAIGTSDLSYVYAVKSGLYLLLPASAIVPRGMPVDRINRGTKNTAIVRNFYETVGWATEGEGEFVDAATFTDTNDVGRRYMDRCTGRVKSYLTGGEYLLDAASGPVPSDVYASLSADFRYRVCVDFSAAALRLAQRRLGDRGIYVLADINHLPFRTGVFDNAMSLHTIYHIDANLQADAIAELARVTRNGKTAVIVYQWREAPMMNLAHKTRIWLGALRKRQKPRVANAARQNLPQMYFAPQDYQWYEDNLKSRFGKNIRLAVFSMIDHRFSSLYLRGAMGVALGRLLLAMEATAAPVARYCAYPVFVITARRRETLSSKPDGRNSDEC